MYSFIHSASACGAADASDRLHSRKNPDFQKHFHLIAILELSFGAIAALGRAGAPAWSKLHVFVYTLSFCVRRRRCVGPLAIAQKSGFLEAI
ncbi:MAG: hypothetical protein LJE92_15950 [Gammaproteobacteria bacterium]|jgi:hypothetical protein|nr:hypothetical protein [Gammaproteobacteria bacterium]